MPTILQELKSLKHSCAKITFADGEAVVASDIYITGEIDEPENAFIFTLLHSNRPDKWPNLAERPTIYAKVEDVLTCEKLEPDSNPQAHNDDLR
jgi:hypothetical protein